MKFRNPKKLKPAFALIAEDENGRIEIVEYVSADDPRLKSEPWISAKPTDPGASMSMNNYFARLHAGHGTSRYLLPEDLDILVRCSAASWCGCGNFVDLDGDPIPFPPSYEERVELLKACADSGLFFAVAQLARRAMEAAMRRDIREASDLGNSSTSSAGTTEAAGRVTSAGAEPTQTVQ